MERTTVEMLMVQPNESGAFAQPFGASVPTTGGASVPTTGGASVPTTGGRYSIKLPDLDDSCHIEPLPHPRDRGLEFSDEEEGKRTWENFDELINEIVRMKPWYINEEAEIAAVARENRELGAERFTAQYNYGKNTEQRYCVWSEDSYLWSEKSSGIMWVGVHGADSVCVVTRKGDLDTTRVRGNLKITSGSSLEEVEVARAFALFRKSIICELEDLADPSSKLCQRIQKSIKKPFGVVSANQGTDNICKGSIHEASSAKYYVDEAIKFLEEEMKRDTKFTVAETTKAAIFAFQHLCEKKLEPTDIEVSVIYPGYYLEDFKEGKDPTVKVLETDEIAEHLNDIVKEHSVYITLKKQRTSQGSIKHVATA